MYGIAAEIYPESVAEKYIKDFKTSNEKRKKTTITI